MILGRLQWAAPFLLALHLPPFHFAGHVAYRSFISVGDTKPYHFIDVTAIARED